MKRSILALSTLTLALSACSGGDEAPEADAVTETRMDEVDVIDGTISDDMVDLDMQKDSDALDGEDGSGEAATDADSQDTSDNANNNSEAEAAE